MRGLHYVSPHHRPFAIARSILALAARRTTSAITSFAREALQQGQVLPLRQVLDKVERVNTRPGTKIEFERDDGRYVYEIRLLQRTDAWPSSRWTRSTAAC